MTNMLESNEYECEGCFGITSNPIDGIWFEIVDHPECGKSWICPECVPLYYKWNGAGSGLTLPEYVHKSRLN